MASATSNRKNAVIWPEMTPFTGPCYRGVRGFTRQDPSRHNPVTPPAYAPILVTERTEQLNPFRSRMQNRLIVKGLWALAVALVLAYPQLAFAQADARFSGAEL